MEFNITGVPEGEYINGQKVTWNGHYFSVRLVDNKRDTTSGYNLATLKAHVDQWHQAEEQERREEAVKRAMRKNPILVPAVYGREIVQVRGRHAGDWHKLLVTYDNGQKHQVEESRLYSMETDLDKLIALYDQHQLLTEQMQALQHSFYEVDRFELVADIQYRPDTDDFYGTVIFDGKTFHSNHDNINDVQKELDRTVKEHVFPWGVVGDEDRNPQVVPSPGINWGEVFKTREDAEAFLALSQTREQISAEISEISIPFDYEAETKKVMDARGE